MANGLLQRWKGGKITGFEVGVDDPFEEVIADQHCYLVVGDRGRSPGWVLC